MVLENSRQKMVLIGGGHSHAIAIREFIHQPPVNTQITLITDVVQATYSGMLPGYIAGYYSFEECHINLIRLAAAANIDILIAKVVGLDVDKQQVFCDNSQVISYDILSINIGSTPDRYTIAGADHCGTAVKPTRIFLAAWQELLQQWQDSQRRQDKTTITIVGGGAGGIELALNMHHRLGSILGQQSQTSQPSNSLSRKKFILEQLGQKLKINLLHRQPELLPQDNPWVGSYVQKLLNDRQIQLYLGETVDRITPKDSGSYNLHCQSGLELSSDRVFWVTNATTPSWIQASGLSTSQAGFIAVNTYLQSISHPQVFAAGDIASMVHYQLPKAGVFAVRQGKPLSINLRLGSQGQTLKPYHPQSHYLRLISTGDKKALAVYGNFGVGGRLVSPFLWCWKDWIDRQFLRQFP